MIYSHISIYFEEKLSDLKCQRDTKSYIIGIFSKYQTIKFDYSQYSVGMMFSQARENNNFSMYQNLADYIFFTNIFNSQNFKHASKDYYDTIGKLSYYSCYRIIKEWRCFEEMADQFNLLEKQVKNSLF